MTMPMRFLGSSSTPQPIPELTNVDEITDPEERKRAIMRNNHIKRLREADELAEKTRLESEEAKRQSRILEQIPTLTPEERRENKRLTDNKIYRAIIAEKRRSQVAWDAEIALSRDKEQPEKL